MLINSPPYHFTLHRLMRFAKLAMQRGGGSEKNPMLILTQRCEVLVEGGKENLVNFINAHEFFHHHSIFLQTFARRLNKRGKTNH